MLIILAILQAVFVLSMVFLVFMQKTSTDGMANLAGSTKSMHSSMRMDFVKKSTIFFATAFFINSLIMANIGYHQNHSVSIAEKIQENNNELPLDDESE